MKIGEFEFHKNFKKKEFILRCLMTMKALETKKQPKMLMYSIGKMVLATEENGMNELQISVITKDSLQDMFFSKLWEIYDIQFSRDAQVIRPIFIQKNAKKK